MDQAGHVCTGKPADTISLESVTNPFKETT